MAASSDPGRRRRYTRHAGAVIALTPLKLTLLMQVAEYGIVSLPQLAKLSCPSEKSARRHLRELFDAGLVDVVPVSRAALAEPENANDASILYGSAPNVYTISRAGLRVLRTRDLVDDLPSPPRYGPKNSQFLAHELAIRDIRVWFELVARHHAGQMVERWADGAAAEIDLNRRQMPKVVRPDAWFIYRVHSRVLVGLVEVDRGTERGAKRWCQKLAAYNALYAGGRLAEVTGYTNARVLVVTPDAKARDRLANLIARHATPELAERFWLADRTVLSTTHLTASGWRNPGSDLLRPLISPDLATPIATLPVTET